MLHNLLPQLERRRPDLSDATPWWRGALRPGGGVTGMGAVILACPIALVITGIALALDWIGWLWAIPFYGICGALVAGLALLIARLVSDGGPDEP